MKAANAPRVCDGGGGCTPSPPDTSRVPPPRYDDYDYGDVNQLLELRLKVYMKTVACHPEETSARMYAACWRLFRHSEKVRCLLPSGTVPQEFRLLCVSRCSESKNHRAACRSKCRY